MLKRSLGLVAICAALLSLQMTSRASAYEARTSDTAGVRVVVVPKTPAQNAKTWDFEVTMDTHTKPLTEDLSQTVTLVVGTDRAITPIGWQGDAPGGHHRKGVLSFEVPPEMPAAFELRSNIGGAVRTFRWETK